MPGADDFGDAVHAKPNHGAGVDAGDSAASFATSS